MSEIAKTWGVGKGAVSHWIRRVRFGLRVWNAAREAVGKDTVAIPSVTQAQAILTGVRRAS